jgi:hypothetical protein
MISNDQGTFKLPRSGVAESAKINKNIKINQTIVLSPLNGELKTTQSPLIIASLF